jgi:hypothetical protein
VNLSDVSLYLGIHTFELPNAINLQDYEAVLRSTKAKEALVYLYNNDVEYTNISDSITAAIFGVNCREYLWHLQVFYIPTSA